jgi:transposase InsO family protein
VHKAFDEKLNNLILTQYNKDSRQGITRLKMNIKKIHGITLTKATVYRYMRLNHIQSIIRRKKRKYSNVKHHVIPNLLQRDFTTERPNQKWSIDISYLFGKQKTIYLCAIKDLYDKSIIAYQMSSQMGLSFVSKTINMAMDVTPQNQREGLILHSDQGSHFIGPQYRSILKHHHIKHSVSYRGSCVDNCPIESWFSALKTESIYLYPKLSTNELITLVNDYVKYYNEERLQEKLKELAPIDYRKQALSVLF